MSELIDLSQHERKILSQSGEDGITLKLLELIGTTNKFYVEIGCMSGEGCSNMFWDTNWQGLVIDANPVQAPRSVQATVTAENINGIFHEQNIPRSFDFFSLDVDYNTFWIWKALGTYRPRIICVEYNGCFGPNVNAVVRYKPDGVWMGDQYFGGSLMAFHKLARSWGYSLVYATQNGVNAFFVADECIRGLNLKDCNNVAALWRPLCWSSHRIFEAYE